MENSSSYEPLNENSPAPQEGIIIFPPKFEKTEQPSNVWLRSFISLALYLILGYYIFHSFIMLLIITAIVVFHELGHFFAMKYYRYSDLGIFFIPLLGAYVSGTKREVSQKESAVILLAGPLPGIIIGIALYFIDQSQASDIYFYDVSLSSIAGLMIFLNIINLIPVYPLDGGQLLNRVFLDEEGWLSKIFVFLSVAFLCWVAWKLSFWILLIFPAMMLLRLRTDSKFKEVEKTIESDNINVDLSYEELKDEDYWKIRNILIAQHPGFKDFQPGPPFEFDDKEEKIMTTIQSLLHRHLIQDVSIAGKIFILLLWIAAIGSPWYLEMDIQIFRRFGF
ncbi:MAG: site-2 protease family protein [Chitinophagaceae bacterium]